MFLLTLGTFKICPLEEASCIVPSVSSYSQVILQGGLQSAEQLYGPIVSPSLTVSFLLLSVGSGSINNLSGLSTNKANICDSQHFFDAQYVLFKIRE